MSVNCRKKMSSISFLFLWMIVIYQPQNILKRFWKIQSATYNIWEKKILRTLKLAQKWPFLMNFRLFEAQFFNRINKLFKSFALYLSRLWLLIFIYGDKNDYFNNHSGYFFMISIFWPKNGEIFKKIQDGCHGHMTI